MQKFIQDYLDQLKPKFPQVELVEADDPELEDDSIQLNEKYHIQVSCDWKYGTLVEELPGPKFKFYNTSTLDNTVKACIKSNI